jgi:putative DNA primase/helicase
VLDEEVRKRRKNERIGTAEPLRAPEPWSDPVNGEILFNEMARTLSRYVVLPKHAESALVLWIVMAHGFDCFDISPILAIESPERRCGKTTLLSLLQLLVPKPLTAASLTPATAFRAVEAFRPTLLIDEGDTFLKANNPELVGILNSGHARAIAFVLRTVGDNHDVKQFTTWCPKAIALIGELPPTLQDRAIVVQMRRKQKNEQVERWRGDRIGPLLMLCRKAARWSADNADALRDCDPDVPDQLDDRAADNWRPLIAIPTRRGGAGACTTPSVQVRHAYLGRRVTITRILAGILSSRRDVSSPMTWSAPPQHGQILLSGSITTSS